MLIKALGNNVNWEFYNYLQYLKTKQAIEESNTTLIPEEFSNRQANRPTHYNIVIVGNSLTTVDFGTITGTLTGWYFDGTDWYLDTAISTGLSGTTLTYQTGTQYVAFADDNYVYISNNNNSLIRLNKTDYSYVAEISTSTSGILSTNNDSPLLPFSLDIIGVIDCDEGLFPTDYTGTTTNATTYTGRKDQPLTIGGVAVNLDTTRNKEIQCSQSLTGVTVTAVYGEVGTTGEQIQIADIGIDTVNDKLYNTNVGGYDIKLHGVILSDSTSLWFTNNTTDDSVIMTDISNNVNHATIVFDVVDYVTSQKYFNISVLNGFTKQTDGSTIEYVPNKADGSTITHTGFTISDTYPSGVYLHELFKQYVQLPPFKTLEYAYQSNEEYWRNKLDSQGNAVLDRHLVPISLEHSDRNFPAFVFKSGSEWDFGTWIDDKTITQVLGSNNVPSDFTISSGSITAVAGVSFAALVLNNGDKLVYAGNNSYLLQNTSGANHGTLTTANVALNQGTQDVFDPFEDGFSDEGVTYNNAIINSNDFLSVWTSFKLSRTPNSILLPDGINNSTLFEENTTLNSYYYMRQSSIIVQSNVTYRQKGFFKAKEIEAIFFTHAINNGSGRGVQVNLLDGSFYNLLGVSNISVESHPNDWWEISFEFTTPANTANLVFAFGSYLISDIGSDMPHIGVVGNGFYAGNIECSIVSNFKLLPKHPYNGTDVFGNTLTTPRSKEVTKALKYTT